MRVTTYLTTTSALMLCLAAAPLHAQDAAADDQKNGTAEGQEASEERGASVEAGDSENGSGKDVLIVTVGDNEILGSDVNAAISMLPPQLRQQSSAMIVPMAVNQLIARQLILDAAMNENFDEDPEVVALVDEAQNGTEEDAIVQVWLDRKLDERVGDAEVQAEYDEIKAGTEKEIPPLEDVRAQIEQQLRQEAFAGLQEDLREDVTITFYGPDGQPQTASSENTGKDEG